jgi:hypothetical protein
VDAVLPASSFEPGYKVTLTIYDGCFPGAKALSAPREVTALDEPGKNITIGLSAPLVKDKTVCLVVKFDTFPDSPAKVPDKPTLTVGPLTVAEKPKPPEPCPGPYDDCGWGYTAAGGLEQSGSSAQNSSTNGFIDLFFRSPRTTPTGSAWAEVRFLGAPTNSNTQGVVSAATDPSANLTASSIASVGNAVDYIAGYQWDFLPTHVPAVKAAGARKAVDEKNRSYSLSLIAAFGATTPLSSQTATIAYAMPAYGSNECTQLLSRFSPASGYSPGLPPSGSITTTTQVTTGGVAAPPTTSTNGPLCSVIAIPTSSVASLAGTTVTTTTSGTQITTVAFAPTDRSSFLLKYIVGLRLIDRVRPNGKPNCNPGGSDNLSDNCSRYITDISIGQDQAITGGVLRHAVIKTNLQYHLPFASVPLYAYASAAIRTQRNQNQDPLVLTQIPLTSSAGVQAAGGVTIPSPSVFVLPLRQSNRDFYRFGVAVDLAALFAKKK